MEDQDQQDLGSELAARGSKRRRFVRAGLALGGLGALGRGVSAFAADKTIEMPMASGTRLLAKYPQKRELILLTARPVQLETPMAVFDEGAFTPNDAFFVRWHLAGVPTAIDPGAFRIAVQGHVKQTLTLSLADLKRDFEQVEIAAVCQCSGNSRGFFEPRVAGGQWANGAMGNALWKGVRLRDVLNKAGVEADAVQVRFNGADQPAMDVTPDFVKALDTDVALNEDVLIAYEMNGAPLPVLNGFPVRLVVPGYYATYWVKALESIEVIAERDRNYWMNPAYRIPDNPCACVAPGQTPSKTTPIGRMNVRSFVTSLADGAKVKGGRPLEVRGIAFDGGFGIARVLFSIDGGRHWELATLGKDHGKYSFREWSVSFTPKPGQHYELACLAVNGIGESQRFTPIWNATGYMRNVVETYRVAAV
jgi:DMSO/TMAO reductase YedYZ molybdopterin-dependent catalytic subunit